MKFTNEKFHVRFIIFKLFYPSILIGFKYIFLINKNQIIVRVKSYLFILMLERPSKLVLKAFLSNINED